MALVVSTAAYIYVEFACSPIVSPEQVRFIRSPRQLLRLPTLKGSVEACIHRGVVCHEVIQGFQLCTLD